MDDQNSHNDVNYNNLTVHSPIDDMVENHHMNSVNHIPVVQSHNLMALPHAQQVILPSLSSGLEPVSMQNNNQLNDYTTSLHPESVQNLLLGYSGADMNEENNRVTVNEQTLDMDTTQLIQQIQDEGRRKAQNTLVGRLADFMSIYMYYLFALFLINVIYRQMDRPVTLEECINAIGDNFTELRKADGTKYKGDHFKAINGALFSTGVFKRTDIDAYEERMQKKFEERCRKRKSAPEEPIPMHMSQPKKRKYTCRRNKRESIIHMLQNITDNYRQQPQNNQSYLKNPFKGLTGDEDIPRLRKRLGEEKYEFLLQIYSFFEDKLLFPANANITSLSMMDGGSDYMRNIKNEGLYMQRDIEEMKKQIVELKERVACLEKYSVIQSGLI
ncbi:hypothetical protein WA158_003302 [Blastocystis sp. Blastoise]